jgi:hypothetical protein
MPETILPECREERKNASTGVQDPGEEELAFGPLPDIK